MLEVERLSVLLKNLNTQFSFLFSNSRSLLYQNNQCIVVVYDSARNPKLGGNYMTKTRPIIVGIFSIVYLILFIMKVEMPRSIFIILLTIVLINQVIDEWNNYNETKEKIHLLIPVTFIAMVIIFLIS